MTETRAADRQQIRDLILGYCRGVDRLDLDLVRAAYHHAVREFTHSDAQRRVPAEGPAVRGSRTPDDPVFVQLARLRAGSAGW